MKPNGDGTYSWVPVSECDHGCAINGICGTEQECNTARIVGIVVGSIFGAIFLCCCCCFLCAGCKVVSQAANSPAMVEETDSYKPSTEMVTTTYNQAPNAVYYQPDGQMAMPA